ncbi:MAG: hypothetical protein ICV83_00250 [Cytophagales bacterium]|nr:hypothetical protein [Cytophagales bacterium]
MAQKRRVIETCLAQKVSLCQELRGFRRQSVEDLAEPEELGRVGQSESVREELFGEINQGSLQLDALTGEIECLQALPREEIYAHVQLGAVVRTDRLNLLVVVSQPPFRVEGEASVGVSTQSPLFSVARGLGQGDSFTLLNRTYQIKEVF